MYIAKKERIALFFVKYAVRETRTLTAFATTTSRWRVYHSTMTADTKFFNALLYYSNGANMQYFVFKFVIH